MELIVNNKEIVQQLLEVVKSTAPIVWDAAYRQLCFEAVCFMFAGGAFALIYKKLTKLYEKKEGEIEANRDREGILFSYAIMILITAIMAIILCGTGITMATQMIVNPNWAIIQKLVDLR